MAHGHETSYVRRHKQPRIRTVDEQMTSTHTHGSEYICGNFLLLFSNLVPPGQNINFFLKISIFRPFRSPSIFSPWATTSSCRPPTVYISVRLLAPYHGSYSVGPWWCLCLTVYSSIEIINRSSVDGNVVVHGADADDGFLALNRIHSNMFLYSVQSAIERRVIVTFV
jgi:hypothetical protein